ncbi:MAG: hypothetical protein ACR2FM_03295 [Candidatus Saccharimonadales bacterium]
MSFSHEFSGDAIVAASWHKVASEAPREYTRGSRVTRVLGGMSTANSRVICLANETTEHVSAIVGDLDTKEATIVWEPRDYSELIAEGPNPLAENQIETTLRHLCERLRSC